MVRLNINNKAEGQKTERMSWKMTDVGANSLWVCHKQWHLSHYTGYSIHCYNKDINHRHFKDIVFLICYQIKHWIDGFYLYRLYIKLWYIYFYFFHHKNILKNDLYWYCLSTFVVIFRPKQICDETKPVLFFLDQCHSRTIIGTCSDTFLQKSGLGFNLWVSWCLGSPGPFTRPEIPRMKTHF